MRLLAWQTPEMPTSAERAAARAQLHGYVYVWAEATRRQRDRVLDLSETILAQPPGTAYDDVRHHVESDLVLFAVALRNLLRAVEWAQATYAPTLDKALEQFQAEVPHAVDLRDVLEHFDDYEQGIGQLQNPKNRQRRADKGRPAPNFEAYGYSFAHIEGTVRLEFGGEDAPSLDVVTASAAAAKLAEVALNALSSTNTATDATQRHGGGER